MALIVLNGPSSAGKTTLATALCERRGPKSAAVSIDQFFPMVAGAHPNNWDLFLSLTEATASAARALSARGFEVYVDTVFERPECWERVRAIFGAANWVLIAVTCRVDVLDERERARGNRRSGQARGQLGRVFEGIAHDLTVDTSEASLDNCVAAIAAAVDERFGRL